MIDDHIVITGSYNFTSSAEKDNDENLVIVDDPGLARAYLDEFQRVCAGAGAVPLSDRRAPSPSLLPSPSWVEV